MSHVIDAVLLEDTVLSLDDLAKSCQVRREWIIERVQWGLLSDERLINTDPDTWMFGSRSFLRIRRLVAIERDFESNPELAGLVADLLEEIESLHTRLRVSGRDGS